MQYDLFDWYCMQENDTKYVLHILWIAYFIMV